MCVILAVGTEAQDVTADEFRKARTSNRDGYGVAWVEGGRVKYKKILKPTSYDEDFRPPKPYVMHFRLSTVGGNDKRLCHPFVVDRRSRPKAKGIADEVLFHNGHVSRWEEMVLKAYSSIGRIPKGPYSDSRAVAMLLGGHGDNIFEMPAIIHGNRYLVFDSGGFTMYGYGWSQGKDGVHRSNESHLNWSSTGVSGYSSYVDDEWQDHWRAGYGGNERCIHCHAHLTTYNRPQHAKGYCRHCELTQLDGMSETCEWCQSQMAVLESLEDGVCSKCRDAARKDLPNAYEFCRASGCIKRLYVQSRMDAGYCIQHTERVEVTAEGTVKTKCPGVGPDNCPWEAVMYQDPEKVETHCFRCDKEIEKRAEESVKQAVTHSLNNKPKELPANLMVSTECINCATIFFSHERNEEVVCNKCRDQLNARLGPPICMG